MAFNEKMKRQAFPSSAARFDVKTMISGWGGRPAFLSARTFSHDYEKWWRSVLRFLLYGDISITRPLNRKSSRKSTIGPSDQIIAHSINDNCRCFSRWFMNLASFDSPWIDLHLIFWVRVDRMKRLMKGWRKRPERAPFFVEVCRLEIICEEALRLIELVTKHFR